MGKDFGNGNSPEKLDSMETVWKGITHLKSTRDYLDYLASIHPKVQVPQYIQKLAETEDVFNKY